MMVQPKKIPGWLLSVAYWIKCRRFTGIGVSMWISASVRLSARRLQGASHQRLNASANANATTS